MNKREIEQIIENEFVPYKPAGADRLDPPMLLRVQHRRGRTTTSLRRPYNGDVSAHLLRLGVDADVVMRAWDSLGARSINSSVVIQSYVAAEDPEFGPIHCWHGLSIGIRRDRGRDEPVFKDVIGFAVRVGGALVSSLFEGAVVEKAREVRELGGAVDWSKVRIWTPGLWEEICGMIVTNVDAQSGVLLVYGLARRGASRPEDPRHSIIVAVEKAPDGRPVTKGDLAEYVKWSKDFTEDMRALYEL